MRVCLCVRGGGGDIVYSLGLFSCPSLYVFFFFFFFFFTANLGLPSFSLSTLPPPPSHLPLPLLKFASYRVLPMRKLRSLPLRTQSYQMPLFQAWSRSEYLLAVRAATPTDRRSAYPVRLFLVHTAPPPPPRYCLLKTGPGVHQVKHVMIIITFAVE